MIKSFENKWHMEFGNDKANKYWSWACFNSNNRCEKCGLHPTTHGITYVGKESIVLCHGDTVPENADKDIFHATAF